MKWEVDGRIYAGLLFDSERELEAFLCDRAPISFDVSPSRQTTLAVDGKHTGRGRPSKQPFIAAAVAQLGKKLDNCPTLAERARLVMKTILEQVSDQRLVPQRRAIEVYLAELSRHAKNRAKKARKKSKRVRRVTAGGSE
jgi:hypothetical protein